MNGNSVVLKPKNKERGNYFYKPNAEERTGLSERKTYTSYSSSRQFEFKEKASKSVDEGPGE